MKFSVKIFAVIVFLLSEKINAQGGPLFKYAISYSAENWGYKTYSGSSGKKTAYEGQCKLEAQDTLMNFILYGLRKNTKSKQSPKEILLAKYPPSKAQFFGVTNSYDSLKNQLLTSTNNSWTSTSSTYSFDSAGRVIKLESSYQGEASGSGGSSITVYKYDLQKNSIIIHTSYGRNEFDPAPSTINTLIMDSTLTFPLAETVSYLKQGITISYSYVYDRKKLKKIIKKEKRKDAEEVVTVYKYKFEV